MMVTKDWEKGKIFFNEYEKILEIGCTTLWIYSTLLNSTLKNNKDGKFMFILPQLKIKKLINPVEI